MNITNHSNLPTPIVYAIENDDYSPGESDITVTTLISPPRQVALIKQHNDNIVIDASSRLFALMGKAMHSILENYERDELAEERLYMDIEGWKLGGKYDRIILEEGVLQDYKFCSVWEYVHGLKQDRVEQLNTLAALAIYNGYIITKLQVVMLFRDWMPSRLHENKYPQHHVELIDVPLWKYKDTITFIKERMKAHQAAQAEGAVLPECTGKERWQTETTYAVESAERKRALRLLDSYQDAIHWIANNPDKANLKPFVTERPGEFKRCKSYCDAADFCDQWKELQNA